ncbi:MAG: hypothetical protein R3D31_04780 [Hyphomicrobiaceae bacterium]
MSCIITLVVVLLVSWRLTLRSIARSAVINFSRDNPDAVIREIELAGIDAKISQLIASNLLQRSNGKDRGESKSITNGEESTSIHEAREERIRHAVKRKIRRNVYKFNQFSGPVYPTYRLDDNDIVHYHFILEKLREPGFAGRVAKRLVFRELIMGKKVRIGIGRRRLLNCITRRALRSDGVNNAFYLMRKFMRI